jgi:hypothetical protein
MNTPERIEAIHDLTDRLKTIRWMAAYAYQKAAESEYPDENYKADCMRGCNDYLLIIKAATELLEDGITDPEAVLRAADKVDREFETWVPNMKA